MKGLISIKQTLEDKGKLEEKDSQLLGSIIEEIKAKTKKVKVAKAETGVIEPREERQEMADGSNVSNDEDIEKEN